MKDVLILRQTACFTCGEKTLRITKTERGVTKKPFYTLECMACPGHGDITMVKRDGEPVNSFTINGWGPSETPPQIFGEFPLR